MKKLKGKSQSLEVQCNESESLNLKIKAVEKENMKLRAEVMNLASEQDTGEAVVSVNNESVAEIKKLIYMKYGGKHRNLESFRERSVPKM